MSNWQYRGRLRAIYASVFFTACLPLMLALMLAHTVVPVLRIYTSDKGMTCVAIWPAFLSPSNRAHWLLYNAGSFQPRLKGQMAELWQYLMIIGRQPGGPKLHAKAANNRVVAHYEAIGLHRQSPGSLWMTFGD